MAAVLRRGFTLIEMLVVIGIILLLAMLLMPALTKAREVGRGARCASNLRQLQIAAMNYHEDRGGFPPALSVSVFDSERGVYTHIAGWVSWYNYANGHTNASKHSGSYSWQGANGVACITNGVLWSYTGEKGLYLCPTFALRSVCGANDAVRSYSMNTNASGVQLGKKNWASTLVLFGDDASVTSSPYDGAFGTNDVGKWHSGTRGHVVYADGRVEKR